MTEEVQKQPENRPITRFEELATGIAEGREGGSPRLNEFLQLGIEHFKTKAEKGGVFSGLFEQLAVDYEKAFAGGWQDRMNFCFDEAKHLIAVAEETETLGDSEGAEKLRERAKNWQQMAMTLTMFPE